MRPIPVRDPEGFELQSRYALGQAGWYARLGHVPDSWPLTIGQAVELFRRGGEYDVTAEQLEELGRRGIVSLPDDEVWFAGDIIQAGQLLESRRAWMPTPSMHDAKKHPHQLAVEEAATSGSIVEFRSAAPGPQLDVIHLLILMTECENREVREKLLVQLLAELAIVTHRPQP